MKFFLIWICKIALMSGCKSKMDSYADINGPGKSQREFSESVMTFLFLILISEYLGLRTKLLIGIGQALVQSPKVKTTKITWATQPITFNHAGVLW